MSNIKLIFEGWRRHLAEQEDREAFEKLVQYFKDSAEVNMDTGVHVATLAKSIGEGISKKFYEFLLEEKRKTQEEMESYFSKFRDKMIADRSMQPGSEFYVDKIFRIEDIAPQRLLTYFKNIENALSVYKPKE